eukprot:CAMPEP_0173217044 /NCGR_PEP_ID=MMETSP1142-20121109/269_1 /TAXON_ID=483371 /ORGANISM="non described non described, Strain CCMP2298" /LENGTH=77 /DNA_ID=CAMNT_0014144565 /DNA_START=860 /DNA_END=1093 /DNA_ORIENTATION=-
MKGGHIVQTEDATHAPPLCLAHTVSRHVLGLLQRHHEQAHSATLQLQSSRAQDRTAQRLRGRELVELPKKDIFRPHF